MTLSSSKTSSPGLPAIPTLVDVEAERSKRSLSYYIRKAWPLIEPGTQYLHNWHIDLISEYLEAVTRSEIQNLIVNISPRCMKSILISVMWPTWMWTHSPEKRFVAASYAENLAVRDAVKSRRIIRSRWYQERFGAVFKMTGDQNIKSRYENDKTGFRYSVGVGGGATGEGGDFIIVDDPLKADGAFSETALQSVTDWWDNTMSTRLNDPKRGGRVIIMQRLHDDDLTGHVLEKMKEPNYDRYEHLVLPMRYEPKRFFSSIGLSDPRSEPGELMWPERMDEKAVLALEASLGEMGTAGQLQQRPAPAGGSIFKAEWWQGKNRYRANDRSIWNRSVARWLSFDTAFKDDNSNDPTAMWVLDLSPEYYLLLRHLEWKKLQFPQLASEIKAQAERWNYDDKLRGVIIEDKGSGISVIQTLRQEAPDWLADLILAFNPGSVSKVGRARTASLWCERGCVWLPEPSEDVPWLHDFEEEHLYKFPASKFDDPEDAMVQGIIFLEHLLAEGWRARLAV